MLWPNHFYRYLLLRAADTFKTQHGHYPGHFDEYGNFATLF